jgi:hypothetical protein
MKTDYFIAFEQHRSKSLSEFAAILRSVPKKSVGSVQIAELCADYPHGLYLFFNEAEEPWYVGKATSRSFIERVPSHFVQREEAWFNTLPKRIMTVCQLSPYSEALTLALTLRLVLIGIENKRTATKLEQALRGFLQPKLNPGLRPRFSGDEMISSYEVP